MGEGVVIGCVLDGWIEGDKDGRGKAGLGVAM